MAPPPPPPPPHALDSGLGVTSHPIRTSGPGGAPPAGANTRVTDGGVDVRVTAGGTDTRVTNE